MLIEWAHTVRWWSNDRLRLLHQISPLLDVPKRSAAARHVRDAMRLVNRCVLLPKTKSQHAFFNDRFLSSTKKKIVFFSALFCIASCVWSVVVCVCVCIIYQKCSRISSKCFELNRWLCLVWRTLYAVALSIAASHNFSRLFRISPIFSPSHSYRPENVTHLRIQRCRSNDGWIYVGWWWNELEFHRTHRQRIRALNAQLFNNNRLDDSSDRSPIRFDFNWFENWLVAALCFLLSRWAVEIIILLLRLFYVFCVNDNDQRGVNWQSVSFEKC